MAADAQERTEKATEKRLKDARREGRIGKSRDLMAWTSVAAGVLMAPATVARGQAATEQQVFTARDVIAHPTPAAAQDALVSGLASLGHIVLPMLVVVAATAAAAGVVQGGVHPKRLLPDASRFDPIAGLSRIVGPRAAWEAVKTLAKAALVGVGFAVVLHSWMPVLLQSGGLSLSALIQAAGGGAAMLLEVAVAAGLLFAALDVAVVIRRNRKATRMTKREVKDENKNTDGDPLVRSQRRSRQLTMSRNRMIGAIADADVVIVNPTHVAVALKYEPGSPAPRLVAKGADLIAARIREEAAAKGVPMVQDVPLARALHAACEVGQQIPVEHYVQVANVLAFVMALKRRGTAVRDRILTVPANAANATAASAASAASAPAARTTTGRPRRATAASALENGAVPS